MLENRKKGEEALKREFGKIKIETEDASISILVLIIQASEVEK